MPDRIDGKRVTKREFLDRAGVSVALQQRLAALEAKAASEMARRIRVEQQLAGYRSACRRLQAALAQRKADEMAQQARVFDVEPAP
jgi:hypothetical protein